MAQKRRLGKSTDGPVSTFINRKISNKITEFIIKHNIPIGPNGMTVISTALGFLAAALFPVFPPLGGVLTQISSILDGVDGELARALNKATKLGAFVDTVLDRFVDSAVMAGAAYALSDPWLGAFAIFGSLMVSYVHSATRQIFGEHPAHWGIKQFASRDVRLFAVFLGSSAFPLGLKLALWYVGLAGTFYSLLVLYKAIKRFGKSVA